MSGAGLGLVVVLAACGGKVIVDAPGGTGGAGGTPITTTTTATSSTGVGPLPCSTHADCPGGLCIFSLGICAEACEPDSCASCSPGTLCEPCATSSCPKCNDCLSACVPTQPGRCDDDDPCPQGEVCIFQSHACAPACMTDAGCDGFSFCDVCATSSCCGCENCVAACVGGE